MIKRIKNLIKDKKKSIMFGMSSIYFIIALISIVFLGIFFNRISMTYMVDELKTQMINVVNEEGINKEEKLEYCTLIINNLCVNNDIVEYSYMNKDENETIINSIFNEVKQSNEEIKSIKLYTSEYQYDGNRSIYNISLLKNEVWYNRVADDINSLFYYENQEGEKRLVLARYVTNTMYPYNYDNPAVIVIEVDSEMLFSDVDDYFKKKISNFIILDNSENIIYYSNKNMDNASLNRQINELNESDDYIIENGMHYLEQDSHIYITRNINKAEWKLLCITDINQILKGTKHIRSTTIILCVLLFIFFVATTLKFTLRLQDRISKIICNMELISHGDLSIQTESYVNDEIGTISNNINECTRQLSLARDKSVNIEKERQKLRFQFLLSQVNTDLLDKTLRKIGNISKQNNIDDIDQMAKLLSSFYESNISDDTIMIRIEDEIQLTESYIKIQNYASNGNINYVNNIDKSVYDLYTIRLVLQPIVENSIIHGIMPNNQKGTIFLESKVNEDNLEIYVIDDGQGFDADKAMANKACSGLGLRSIDERIRIIFGDKYGMKIESSVNKGTKISIRLPIIKNGNI